ncbi:hypothetical protein RJ55_05877 [Drechmeria coniospora]|nr:hypothetical protein RJ55_05877 [Drechmeria coniospora]
MAASSNSPFELPRLRVSFGFENDTRFLEVDDVVAGKILSLCPDKKDDRFMRNEATTSNGYILSAEFFDVKFCPFQPLDCDPVFAAISKKHIIICKLAQNSGDANPLEVINIIRDDDAVNDLVTSPVDPDVIASASDDTSAFHDTGRYLLSSGHDQVINLWTIPDLPTTPITAPIQVHYPHFSTSAVHSGIVDCVAFFGDQVLSRACHDGVIAFWRIEGFSSDASYPLPSDAPTPQSVVPINNEDTTRLTRSAFVPVTSPSCPAQYTRLLEFHTPNCGPQFFMRFKVHHVPGQNAVLAFCNAAGNVLFWDFERLTEYRHLMRKLQDPRRDKTEVVQLPTWLKPVFPRQKIDGKKGKSRTPGRDKGRLPSGQESGPESGQEPVHGGGDFNQETMESWSARYSVENPQEPLRAHRTESSSANFVGRQVAWSPGGDWCVVVGSSNTTLILQRWAKKAPGPAQVNAMA